MNRTNSCAVLRWNYLESESLKDSHPTETVLEKLKALATKDGDIIIKSQTYRDQERNYQECMTKFVQLMRSVYFKPKPRIATKPTKASKKRRLNNKKLHSEKKSLRQKRFD